MKKALMLMSAGLALVACTKTETVYVPSTEAVETSVEHTTSPTTQPTAIPAGDYSNSTEQLFVGFVYDQYPDPIYVSDADIIDTGYAVCDALRAGVSPYMVVSGMLSATDGDESGTLLLTIITGGATGILCPEFAEVWNQ